MNTYTVGALVLLSATFTNQSGAPADPTTITFSVRAPDGTISTPARPASRPRSRWPSGQPANPMRDLEAA